MNNNNNLENLKKMYENVGYFDQYGGSVILFILVTLILFLLISYCYIMINAQPIIDDWANQRCKPTKSWTALNGPRLPLKKGIPK